MSAASFQPSTSIHGGGAPKWDCTYIGIPKEVLRHENFSELSPKAIKLLLSIAAGFLGNNNGHLIATAPIMRTFGINSKDSLSVGIKELLTHGLLIRTRSQQKRDAAQYALSWLPIQPAKPGKPYDPGIVSSNVSCDAWRRVPHHKVVH